MQGLNLFVIGFIIENARDALHRSGRYSVIGGIISPVNDGYKKKVINPQV